jgi:hypothetical protein
MSLSYSTYLGQLANLLATDPLDTEFLAILPGCIDYAEQRIYRELNLLSTRVVDQSATLTPNSRTFTLPSAKGKFITVTALNIITPAGVTTSTTGVRNSIPSVTRNLLDYIAPTEYATSVPSVPMAFYMLDDATAVVGPAPDAAYYVEVIGTIRPKPLSQSNQSTFLTLYLPDLFIAASMVFMAGFQKNFGAQSGNPEMAVSWEAQYQTLFRSASDEELRRKYAQEFNSLGGGGGQ